MEISGDYPGSETKKWVRCRRCKQKMVIEVSDQPKVLQEFDESDASQFTVYSPVKSFVVGESIYHQTWDDYGRVISKEISSNGQNSIKVEFQKVGQKKLIESVLGI